MASGKKKFRQVAALPYRADGRGGFEIALVTTRDSGRWILPKGWPIKGLHPSDAAATEALEEAGLVGRIGRQPIGSFTYLKDLARGRGVRVTVEVYPLEIERQEADWREKGQRTIIFLGPEEAAARVGVAGTADLILAFAARLRAKADKAGRDQAVEPA